MRTHAGRHSLLRDARLLAVLLTVGLLLSPIAAAHPASGQEAARIRSVNDPDRFVSIDGGVAVLRAEPERFRQVAGLSGTGISLESVDLPGYFLRHEASRLLLDRAEESEQFRRDATFLLRPGFAVIGSFSLESVNLRSYYVRHRFGELWLDRFEGSHLFSDDASFHFEAAPVSTHRPRWSRGRGRSRDVTHTGPVGHAVGMPFTAECEVREIRLRTGWWIDGIGVTCEDGDPRPMSGGGGGDGHIVTLEPGERIIGISGLVLSGSRLHGLRIHTDRGSTDMFGGVGGADPVPFRLEVPEGYEFAGFFGNADEFVESIGLIVRPSARRPPARPR